MSQDKPQELLIFPRFFIVVFSIFVGLFAIEVGLRIIAPHSLDQPLAKQVEEAQKNVNLMRDNVSMRLFDPLFHHSTYPNRTVQGVLEDHPYRFTTNNKGCRSLEDFKENKPANVYRVALTGDSFTAGLYVDDKETYAYKLEQMLKQTGAAKEWQIYNFGNISYSPLLYWQQYAQTIKKFHPDLLIIAIDNSDLQDDYYYEHDAIFDDAGNLKGFKDVHYSFFLGQMRDIGTPEERLKTAEQKLSSPIQTLLGWALSHLQLAVHIRDFIDRKNFKRGDIESDRFGHTREGVDWSEHWKRSAKYLDKTVQLAKKDGVQVLILFYPYPHQVNGIDWSGRTQMGYEMGKVYDTPMRQWLADFAVQEKVDYLDTFDDFRKSHIQDFTFRGDPHYLPNGHQLLAESVYSFVTSHYNQPVKKTAADTDSKLRPPTRN